ncbi:glycoside hydrolase family 97 protein [Terrimonas sp. NA20]|uniref:Glycoside hydrolase family 97 protein n=1 Tax=Terrimonas ginsenosidimutans TaxID=2908004 RepID=A0ABS9KMD7_9BACT|nr:glycoside hydrolase family 97 protein [Terrimonas ginsenosidimutans]MCG2613478.1 glycoside hydrolase family 97 protein [Terrimonas ginsenosidimutans]
MNMLKKYAVLLCLMLVFSARSSGQGKPIDLLSPDGKLKVSVELSDQIYYSVSAENEPLFTKNHLALNLKTGTLGANAKLLSAKKSSGEETIKPAVPLKFSSVKSVYNDLLLKFKGNYSIEFRAFNDGIAYRFITGLKDSIEVVNEDFAINFSGDYLLHLQQNNSFKTAYEELYSHIESNKWGRQDKMADLPALIDTRKQYKILISETDLSDYPAMFLKGTGNNGLSAVFPMAPLEFGPDGDRSQKILREADYIARTNGTRSFPWRYFVVTKDDRQLLENTMTLKLAPKSMITDPSWIKPGQVSWEWWNDASPYGPDVNFVSGYNLETYKYYIDFASKYGIPYIIMDEGWAKSTTDPYTPNPKVDVKELIRYGKTKKVDIILWLTWLTVHNNMDLFKTFREWGVKGVKIDFMDRSDQWMVNYYENVVKEAAAHKILVDYHGAFKPAGLEYKYPNLLSYEGVRGLEQMGGCPPDNTIYLPFLRNAVGAMDFTPGAMINLQPEAYKAERPNAAGMGTRVAQLAMYVLFESGLQMLADNPTLYYRNHECTEFITSVPTTWDETRALAAKVGELAVVAKRKDKKWFVGGITNGKEDKRNIELNFDFLDAAKNYTITYFEDGINAGRQAMDYRKKTIQIRGGDTMKITMVRNGGFAAVIE